MSLSDLPDHELLSLFSELLVELKSREMIRSSNNPVADYAEYLVAKALGLDLATRSTTGYDAIDSCGKRYEVKSRRGTRDKRSTQLSVIRGMDKRHFDYLVGVLFNDDFTIHRACCIPYEVVKEHAAYKQHVNGWILHLRDSIWNVPSVVDLTEVLIQSHHDGRG